MTNTVRWWWTWKKPVYDKANELGYMTRYRKDYEVWKFGIRATMTEFHNIKLESGVYE